MPWVPGLEAVDYTQSKRRYPAFIDNLDSVFDTVYLRLDGTNSPTAAIDWDSNDLTDVGALTAASAIISGKAIVGSTVDEGGSLQVQGTIGNQVEIRTNASANTNKEGSIGVTHYDLTEKPATVFYSIITAGGSNLNIGGGSPFLNACRFGNFYAAANNSTAQGDSIARWSVSGFRIEESVSANPTGLFEVVSTSITSLFVNGSSGNVLIGTSVSSGDAILEMSSTTKGFAPSRMTTVQRDAIVTPFAGLLIWNTTTGQLEDYNGAVWAAV